ncbi:MAG: PKD domain-containing protein, partial [Chloroflexota bacterium]
MKRLLTLILSLTVLAGFAQYPVMTATVSGYVTQSGTNLAVQDHMIKISMASYDSTGTYTTSEVYTNANGYYNFTGSINGMSGYMYVETYGCNDYILSEVFELSYNSNNVFNADFQVCDDTLACNADFYNYQLEGLTYAFVDNSWAGTSHTTSWSFGDGTYSYEQNPTKTYDAPGEYEVTLTIANPDSSCSDYISQLVYIGEIEYCKAFYTYWNNPSMENTISFADSSMGAPTSWYWDFGDGSTSTDQFPVHTYAQSGIYFVCLTVTNDSTNCYSNYCDNVMVGDITCMAQFTYWPSVDSLNQPFATQFYDLSYGTPTQWTWSFGDGTASSEQNPIHVYAQSGLYQVCLAITGEDCESTWCMDVYVDQVYPMCYNYFTYSNAGNDVVFEGYCSSSLPTNYLWDFGDGTYSELNPATHTYPAPGVYYVSLETWDTTGCRAYSSQEIVVGDSILYNQIYGQVYEGNFPLTSGFVMIFSVEDATNYYPYFDLALIDPNGVYSFPMVPQGNYNLLAVPTDGSQYLPTYYESTIFWQEASTVVAGQNVNPINIMLQSTQGNATQGTGVISGHINQTGVRDGFVGQIIMYLTDNDHKILSFKQVNTAGDFSFNNLANGNYFLKAELPGVNSEYIPVTLSTNQTEVTIQMTFTGNSILGKPEGISSTADVSIYPNPATNATRIVFNQEETGTVRISLLDI